MKIAITGGAGFIGTVLIKQLLENPFVEEMGAQEPHEVFWIDIRPSKTYPDQGVLVDVTDQKALTAALKDVDVIYHLAAEHRDDVQPVQKYYDVNVQGARNLVLAAQENNIRRIIFTSTVAVYGLNAGPSTEESTPAPFNDYGRSKLESEKIFESWAQKHKDNSLVTLRLVATFGPHNRGNIYTLMNHIAQKKFMMIGSGKNKKSIAYVENVAAFLRHHLKAPAGIHIYNYADKPDLSMKDFVRIVCRALGQKERLFTLPYPIGLAGGLAFDGLSKITGKTFPISAIRVRKFCAETTVNADKVKKTGFQAPCTLKEGLEHMIAHEFPPHEKAS